MVRAVFDSRFARRLRQLTSLSGVVTAPDGSVDVELPGPTAPAF
jgi:hypothetical protein